MVKKALVIFLFYISCNIFALTNEECLNCHTKAGEKALIRNSKEFAGSVHGGLTCDTCHEKITVYPHPRRTKAISCQTCHDDKAKIVSKSEHALKVIPNSEMCESCHGMPHTILNSKNPGSPTSRNKITDTCNNCHTKMGFQKLKDAYSSYSKTVHGKAFLEKNNLKAAICIDCHGSHNLETASNSEATIYKFNIPATCGKCHKNQLKDYQLSIHAQAIRAGKKEAPVCIDCHGEHNIKEHTDLTSTVNKVAIVKTCSHCHSSEKINTKFGLPADRVETYLESYHGIAYQYNAATVANCATCHNYHDILPSSDPRSSVSPANLAKTCGKCHIGASKKVALGSVHVKATSKKDKIIFYVTLFYIGLIVLIIGGMIFHNLLDFGKKLYLRYQKDKLDFVEERFSKYMRIQHFILLLSFILLGYTGFVYLDQNAWWSLPFKYFTDGMEVRKILHRLSALTFVVLIFLHIIWLIFSKHGRRQFIEMLPAFKDITDVIHLSAYNLGLAKHRPLFNKYNYIEKSEYWALIWGGVVMVITGTLLIFKDLALQYFPKWFYDVALTIHLYEAILASLAIVVWHFYWVIFDPDIYPANWVSFNGKITKKQKEERVEKTEGEIPE